MLIGENKGCASFLGTTLIKSGGPETRSGELNLARTSTLLLSRSDLPSHPTQAKEAAPTGDARSSTSLKSLSHDKIVRGLGLSALMGLGLGGSKVVGELEEFVRYLGAEIALDSARYKDRST